MRAELIELLKNLIVAGALAFLIITFVVQAFYIPSSSMETTLMVGDRIFVNKFIYRFQEPARGELVVFNYPRDPARRFIKRIVGMGGEELAIRAGNLYIDGELLEEDYLPEQDYRGNFGPVDIPEGHYFVLGDNRYNSEDSRHWGPLSRDKIVGRAFLIFWPPSRLGRID